MRRNETHAHDAKAAHNDSDVFALLQQERVLFLTSEINAETANTLCGQMLLLDLQDPNQDITLFINSEGGNVTDTLAIYDMMQAVRCDVSTICIGEAASGAAIILSGGTKGKRFALPNARIMMHQPQGGVEGSSRDVEIEAKELIRLRELLNGILQKNTGQDHEMLHKVLDRDSYMSVNDAKNFGVIDRVIDRLR
ncbi:MAG: ATP-dependent Clp protease proteolytic subunit [Micavibrio aeruginosavorus]|uniref:ATP-dependent Clp protease proteolytic subunit n=1 Tax=Micavibrio aeruginosavorus TaxID=349221 RepID=A0A2W5FPJ0_9BACT|nr:MAG: ATP-dependent Clp protease proteolytic subunit [Micavibrio aeruginosavorus]